LENALSQDYPPEKLEVCLISDGSTDATEAIGLSFADRGLKVFHYPERRGKNAALNETVPQTSGEVLVFTDANTQYRPDAVRKLVRHFADPKVGLVVGRLNFISDCGEAVDGGLYWRYENRLKELQSALRSVLVANGSIFAVRRRLVGPLEGDVANDFQTPMEVGSQGYDLLYEPEAIALEKSASDQREEYARKVRIILQGLTGTVKLLGHIRGKRLFFFLSHKFFRWFMGYLQVALLVSNAMLLSVHPLYAVLMACQALFYGCALVGWALQDRPSSPKVFQVPFYLCMVNLAALVASVLFLKGRRLAKWEKAETAR